MASVAGLAGQSRARRSADGGCPWRLRAAAIMLRTPPLSPGWRSDLVHGRHRSGGKSGSEGVAWRDGRGVRQAHLLVDKTDAGTGRAGQAAESSALLRRWFTLSCRSSTRGDSRSEIPREASLLARGVGAANMRKDQGGAALDL